MNEWMCIEHWGNDTDRGKPKYSEENLSQCHLSTTNLTWTNLWMNMGLHNERPVTNHLIHGTAFSLYVAVTLPTDIILLFIHSVVCLMTGPLPLPKWVLHTVWFSASSFNFQYPLVSLRSSSSCLRLLPRLPVTSILPSIFPSITCFRRQFLRKMWQSSFFLLYVGYSFPPWSYVIHQHISMISPTDLLHPSLAPNFETFQVLFPRYTDKYFCSTQD
jgi:hypothetical protein